MNKKEIDKQEIDNLPEQLKADLIHAALDTITQKRAYERFGGKGQPLDQIADSLSLSKTYISKARRLNKKNAPPKDFRTDCLQRIHEVYELVYYHDGSVHLPVADEKNDLRVLAEKLSLNLVDVSTPLGEVLPYSAILEPEHLWRQRKKEEVIRRERFIAIVGAGASNAATPSQKPIPDSQEAIQQIRTAFESDLLRKLIDDKIRYLSSRVEHADDADFELQMKALISFSPELTIKKLKEICGYKHTPSLLYEILAHLLKHRFLDAIVNFNYDELLDNAIEEELPNADDYNFIFTAGHCPNQLEELYIGHRIKQPIYVKCHGTISRPDSLRFRETDAFTIEKAIQAHLEELFIAKMPDNSGATQKELPLNLLVFGFSMNNQAFNQLIKNVAEAKTETVTIWLFDVNPELAQSVMRKLRAQQGELYPNIKIRMIPLKDRESMEKALQELWGHIDASFKEPYKPKGIARHQFVNHIFRGVSPLHLAKESELKPYLKDRLFVEIAILLLQSDGIIHLRQLSDNRGGKMYNKLRALGGLSIHDYLRKMGLVVYKDFLYDTYMIEESGIRKNVDKLISFIRNALRQNLEFVRRGTLVGKKGKRFKELAISIGKRRLAIVNPKYQNVHDNLFSQIEEEHIMNTSLAWIYKYRTRAEQDLDSWDLLLSVTEKGRFLKYDLTENHFADKRFELVLSTYDLNEPPSAYEQELGKLNLLSGRLLYRPWWTHNKHMVIFLKRQGPVYTGDWTKDWKLVEGFFYSHRMLSRRINPIRVTEPIDLHRMLYIYGIYWSGALDYSNTKSDNRPTIGIVSQRDNLDKILQRLFELYEQ